MVKFVRASVALMVTLSVIGVIGASPAAAAQGGYQMAFQANTTSLWSVGDANSVDTRFGMMPGTSPAIAALAGGGYQLAFQANTSELWTVGDAGAVNTRLGMAAGTSPAIAASPHGGYQIAFQANTTRLWTFSSGGGHDTELGMMPGTSPAIAALAGGGYQLAFQANTTELWSVGDAGAVNTRLGMMPGTNPAIAASPAGGYQIAFQANTTRLWTFSSGGGHDTGLGMADKTSPAVTGLATGGLLSPPNLGPPDGNGYYWLPDSQPGGLYVTNPRNCRRGSLALVQVIYTVASRWHQLYPGSPVRVGDLNGSNPPHVSHANGADVDIPVSHLTTGQKIELGRLFADTSIIKLILYSGSDFGTVSGAVNEYSGTNTVRWYDGHASHFHVRILDAFRGPYSRACF